MPSEAEAAQYGLTVEEAAGPPVELWPDHVHAANVLTGMATQWRRAGMTGMATGLDYASLPAVLRLVGVPRCEWKAVFEDLRVMEDAAMAVMNKKH